MSLGVVWQTRAAKDLGRLVRFRVDREAATLRVLRVLPRDKAYR